ncbi:nucleotide cyclase [Haematococcus lacustris]
MAPKVPPPNALPCLLLPRDGSHPPDADLSAWLAHQPGLHPADSQLYFRAVWYAKWHPNLASDINTYYGEFARAAFMKAAYLVLVDPPNQTASTLDEVASIYAATVEGTRRTSAFVPMDLYWQTIGYTPPPAPPLPSTVNASHGEERLGWSPACRSSGNPITGVLLLLASAAVLVYMTRQRQCHRTLLGGVLPPGVAPATTFLVTDIQDSTLLWEALPVEVMDITIALHHAAIRQCLANFCGYEVITEGDSFTIATHTPGDAVLLATHIQTNLMHCAWPEELLQASQCCCVWATPLGTDPAAAFLSPLAWHKALNQVQQVQSDGSMSRAGSYPSQWWN